MGVSKFSHLGFSQLWGPITLHKNLQLKWGLKQSYNLHQKLSNSMSHATYTWGNQGNFWLLVVRNQISNWLLAFLLAITCASNVEMDHASPFQTFMSEDLSNGIKTSSIHWFLTLRITLWNLGNPPRLQLSKWELPWECEDLFPHTLLHSRKHEMWLPSFLLVRPLTSPCVDCEPKARVATYII